MRKLSFVFFAIILAVMVLGKAPARAQAPISSQELLPTNIGTEIGTNPTADVRVTVARIIRVAMSLLGIVAVVIILIGGFKWMTAGGNDDQVAEARKIIIAGVVGLAVILSSYAIANFVIDQLASATNFTP